MPVVVVRRSLAALDTHLQQTVDPITTYCGLTFPVTSVKQRYGYVSCQICIRDNLRQSGRSRGGWEDPLIVEAEE